MTLRRIRIQDLGVIDDAELELAPGLNVITGETGAGKTMVVSGLGLLLGDRADAGMVRTGATRAVVEGEVDVVAQHPAAQRVAEAGGDVQDGLVLVRTVAAEGRSRTSVGGRSAPVSVLSEVGEHLVALHGQADQWRLRDADQHRVLIDAAGGADLTVALAAYQDAWQRWQDARSRLQETSRTSAERAVRVEVLRAALEEIEAVAPQEGEEDSLRAESERLTHADELRAGAQTGHDALTGDESGDEQPHVAGLLAAALAALGPAAAHDDELGGLRDRLQEVSYLSADLASELAAYAAGIEVDPRRLEEVHQRRAALGALLRRYGPGTADVLAFARESAAELARIDVSDEARSELRHEVEALRAAVVEAGVELTVLRRGVAERVGREVTTELSHLAMGSATVTVEVEPRRATEPRGVVPEGAADGTGELDRVLAASLELSTGEVVQPARHGLDAVEIRLAANPGAPSRSVSRAASGGELSRVMLALELVCGDGSVPTYVFDEVDAGVGGAAALDLGARLARLARQAQVVVVTHLGQVAAHADRHLVVRKSTDGQVTRSGVVVVEGTDREVELARMLGGMADSDVALEHARELLSRRATMG